MMLQDLAQALRAMRVNAGMSQHELAAKLACSRANVSLIEQGHHAPSAVLLLAWTEACGRRMAFIDPLVGEAMASIADHDQERALRVLLMMSRLNARQRAAIDSLVASLSDEYDQPSQLSHGQNLAVELVSVSCPRKTGKVH